MTTEKIPIRLRNTTKYPIHLTITISGSGRNDDAILITVGSQGTSLKDWYGACVDQDLEPNKSWKNGGILTIKPRYSLEVNEGSG